MNKYKALFVEESREHLSELSRALVALESTSDPASIIGEVFRHAHSIKGMAASMGYDAIATLAHRMEDVVDARRQRGGSVPKSTVDLLLRGIDALSAQVDAVSEDRPLDAHQELVHALAAEVAPGGGREVAATPGAAAGAGRTPAVEGVPAPGVKAGTGAGRRATPTPTPASATPAGETRVVRVCLSATASAPATRAFIVHKRLAAIASIVEAQPTLAEIKAGDLASPELRLTVTGADEASLRNALATVPDIESVAVNGSDVADVAPRPLRPSGETGDAVRALSTVRVRTEVLDTLINSVGELFIARERLTNLLADTERPEVRAALDVLSARIRELHDQVMAVRMMPLRTLTDRYPRLVRDLARSLDKETELEIEGSEIELDRAILDHLDAVFVHTLRNAVDHGIETPVERQERSKATLGKITITAARDRDMVLVVIEDDGRGLDADLLRRVALERGLVSVHDAESMSARECYFLVCLPGFSTKSVVSDVSGRGVGMDAVRSRIESLGGTLDIESRPGNGTRFIFRLPLTLAIVPVLLVEAAGATFAIPVAKVVSVRERGEDVIRQAGGGTYVPFRHALVQVLELADMLRIRSPRAKPGDFVVVIEDGRDLSGLGVARLIGYHEAVVKPLGEPLDRLDWYSGVAILGDGHPILILDVPRALRQRPAAA